MHLKKLLLTSLIFSKLIFNLINASDTKLTQKYLSLPQSIGVGSLVGGLEVIFPGQILAYAMNRRIIGEPFVLKDSYQGFTTHALGQISLVAVQKTIQVKMSDTLEDLQQSKLSPLQKIGISFVSGVGGALIGTPSNYEKKIINFNMLIGVRFNLSSYRY